MRINSQRLTASTRIKRMKLAIESGKLTKRCVQRFANQIEWLESPEYRRRYNIDRGIDMGTHIAKETMV